MHVAHVIARPAQARPDDADRIARPDGAALEALGQRGTMAYVRTQLVVQSQTDGNDWINGFDVRADVLEGGLGNDTLHGKDGSDSYVFNRGDGQDAIDDNGFDDTDRLMIHGYSPDEVAVERIGGTSDDLRLKFVGTTDQITVWNTLEGSRLDQIEQIVLDDGTIWNMTQVKNLAVTGGIADTIVGTAGDDVLNGLAGNDTLTGLDGNDTFIIRTNTGHDTVTDFAAGADSDDSIEFSGTGFNDFASVIAAAYQDGADAVIEFSAGDSLRLTGVDLSLLHQDDFYFV